MRERGSIAIEASIMILLLAAMFYIFISYALLVRTQVVVQNGLNQSAKEFSQYTYILGNNEYKELNEAENKISTVYNSIVDLQNDATETVEQIGSGSASVEDITKKVDDIVKKGETLGDTVKADVQYYLDNPKTFFQVILQMLKQEAIQSLSPIILEHMFYDYLKKSKIDLSEKGVIGKVEFQRADYDRDKHILTFTIKYKTKGMFYNFFKIENEDIVQKVTIRMWSGE